MSAVRELFAIFDVQFNNSALRAGNREVDRAAGRLRQTEGIATTVTKAFGALGVALGAGAVVRGLTRFVAGSIQIGDELENTALRLGMSTRALQEWQHVAELSNVSAEQFATGVRSLQRQAYEASTGGRESAESFRALGVAVRGADGQLKPVDQLLGEVGAALAGVENPAERTALSMRVLGRGGNALLPMFADGAEGIARMRRELGELGGGASDEMIRQAAALDDQLVRVRTALLSVRSAISTAILPAIEWGARAFTRLSAALAPIVERSHIVEGALVALGVAGVVAGVATISVWGPAALVVLGVVAGVALLALAFDEVWTTLEGGDTLISRAVDHLAGVGSAASGVRELKTAFSELGDVLEGLRPIFDYLKSVIDPIIELDRILSRWGQFVSGGFIEEIAGMLGLDVNAALGGAGDAAARGVGGAWLGLVNRGRGTTAPELSAADQAELEGMRGLESVYPDLFGPSDVERDFVLQDQLGRSMMTPNLPAAGAGAVQATVNAPTSITINDATDPERVGAVVEDVMRRNNERTARQLQAALVPARHR